MSWNLSGNLEELFNPKGLSFHLSLTDLYGGMVRVYGFFGVRFNDVSLDCCLE